MWDAEIQKQKLLTELAELWLLDKNKKLNYSFPPFNIAVISSQNSEWLRDFESILHNAKLNYDIDYYYSNIHGDRSIPDIINAIKSIIFSNEEYKKTNNIDITWKQNKYDFIAFIRWWGWVEWLNWANSPEIVKLVANIDIPIITAIWHTSDKSILDMISKYPCKTPSEWAKIIIDIFEKYKSSLYDYRKNIQSILRFMAVRLKNENKMIYINIINNIKNSTQLLKNELQRNNKEINSLIHLKVIYYKSAFLEFKMIQEMINQVVYKYKKDLQFIKYQIDIWIKTQTKNIKTELNSSYNIIKQHNYERVLKKWYSLTFDKDNKVVNKLEIWWEYLLKNNSWEYSIVVKESLLP